MTQTQNFDGLGTASGAVASALPANWRISGNGAGSDFTSAATSTTQARGTSGANILSGVSAGGLYNFANGVTATATDRAAGFLSSGGFTSPHNLFVYTRNNSGAFVTSLTVAYTIEKYRSGSRAFTLEFWTSTDGTTWTQHAAGTEAFAADANNTTIFNPPTTTVKNFTVTGLAIPNGGDLYCRWSYTGSGGSTNGQGLGIDDVTLTAVNGVPPATAVYSASDFPEDAANNGTITITRTITLAIAQWLNSIANGTPLTPGTHYTTANVPPGMTVAITKNSNTQVTVALTGTATNHAVANNVGNVTLTFQDAVIEGGTHLASAITGLNRNNLTVTFLNPSSRIREIQGAQHRSPLVGQLVNTVPGIVTAVRDNGFFMQDPTDDGDVRTSEGMFVFTNTPPPVTIVAGDSVHVSGTVIEFRTSNPDGLTLTEIGAPGLTIVEQALPTMTVSPTLIGSGGRAIPANVISDDAVGGDAENTGTLFDPASDGLDFYESLENMLVRVNDAVIVSTASSPIAIIADNGANATNRTARGGVAISALDDNPERLYLIRNDNSLATPGNRQVGDRYPGALIGIMEYSSDVYRLRYTQALPAVVPSVLTQETTSFLGDQFRLTVASYNAHNMTPVSSHIPGFAGHIVNHLRSPDIIGLQEIQDNSGATDNGVVDATTTLTNLVVAIQAAGGPTYQFRQINPVNGSDGGQPGGNIRVALLYNPSRVQFMDRGTPSSTAPTGVTLDTNGKAQLTISPGRIDPANAAWSSTRKPLIGEFLFNGHKVFVVVAHLSSKIGDGPSFGRNQPPVLGSEAKRIQQATSINTFLSSMLTLDPLANIVVVGDMNEHEFRPAMTTLAGSVLHNLMNDVPISDRYTYNFEGNSQVLDNILVSRRLKNVYQTDVDIVHLNADFHESTQLTDHEAVVARIGFVEQPTAASGTSGVSTTLTGLGISGFTPQYGLRGTVITISGKGFSGTSAVRFGGTSAQSFQVLSDNTILAVVGQGATGLVEVISTQGTFSLAGFIYGTPPPPPPSVTEIRPSTVMAGDTALLVGANLASVQRILLNGEAMVFFIRDDNTIVVPIMTGQIGPVDVQLVAGGLSQFVGTLQVQRTPQPAVVTVTPKEFVSTDANVMVSVNGLNLSRIWQYTLTKEGNNDIQVPQNLANVQNNTLSFIVPPHAQQSGLYALRLFNADGQVVSTTIAILKARSPQFNALEFSTNATGQAGTVIVEGSGFFRSARILLDGAMMSSRFISPTQIALNLSAQMTIFPQSYRVQLINSDGQTTEATLRVSHQSLPYMNNVLVGNQGKEFILTIQGRNFQQGLFLSLNSLPLRVISVNDSTIIAVVPNPLPLDDGQRQRPMIVYLVNPNDTKHGLWISHLLFEQALSSASFTSTSSLPLFRPANVEELEQWSRRLQRLVDFPSTKQNNGTDIQSLPSRVRLYPNPSEDWLTLEIPTENRARGRVRIINALGSTVGEYSSLPDESSVMVIPVGNLAQGAYFVEILSPTAGISCRIGFLKR